MGLGRTRVAREDCEKRAITVEGFFARIDEILTESDLARRAPGQGIKHPDCTWHKAECTYTVLEIKSSSLSKALGQLKNFARNFPSIHSRVERYIIELEGRTHEIRRRGMKLEPVAPGGAGLYKVYRDLGRHKKEWDISGKPLYLRIRRRR